MVSKRDGRYNTLLPPLALTLTERLRLSPGGVPLPCVFSTPVGQLLLTTRNSTSRSGCGKLTRLNVILPLRMAVEMLARFGYGGDGGRTGG